MKKFTVMLPLILLISGCATTPPVVVNSTQNVHTILGLLKQDVETVIGAYTVAAIELNDEKAAKEMAAVIEREDMIDASGRVNLEDYLTLQRSVEDNKNQAREYYQGLQERFNREIGLKIAQAQILVAKINEYQTAAGITDEVMNQLVTEAGGLFQDYQALKEDDLPTGPSLGDVVKDIATRELMETLGYGQ